MARIFMALLAAALLMGNSYRDQAAELLDRNKDAEALALLKEGTDKADATAVAGLAWMYETGLAVVRDTAEAARLYQLAAEAGDAYAQWRLDVMIDMGEISGTPEEAIHLLKASADQGFSNAMASLAVIYAAGQIVPQDFAQTHYYYDLAARQGNSHAIQGLGLLYANGEGVAVDRERACAYWLVAAARANTRAEELLQLCMESMDDAAGQRIMAMAATIEQEYDPRGEIPAQDGPAGEQ